MTQTATIDQLKPGSDYPGGSINSRKTYTDAEIKERLDSILIFGVLQSLFVCPAPGKTDAPFYVAAGGLRRAAIALGVKTKKLPADFPIPIIVRADLDGAQALAASLEENDQILAPHPAETYEQFAALLDRGMDKAAIAKTFRMETKEVDRVLALGALSPVIREAWRTGKLDADAAKAFTLAKDQKHQEDVFRRLRKSGNLNSWNVRRNIVGDQHDTKKFLTFVGHEAYEAAGGTLQQDLFSRHGDSDEVIVNDFALLVRLAGEKIDTKCKALVESGWGWASDKDDIKDFYSLNRVPNANSNLSKEMKAKSGCAVAIDYAGKLDITYGVLKKGERLGRSGSSKSGKKDAPSSPKVISNSLRHDLDAMAARATKDALVEDSYGDEVAITLAKIVANQITPDRINYMPREVREKLSAISDGLTPKVMNEALRKRFDATRYFSSAPKNIVIKAIEESLGSEQAKVYAPGTKVKAWKFAVANVPKTGWLPRELRTAHYDGPKAATAKGAKVTTLKTKKAKAKPASKAPAKRKAA